MKTVLIAHRDQTEAKRLMEVVGRECNVTAICSPEDFPGTLQEVHLVLLDCNFTPNSSVDFIGEILKRFYVPVVMMTPQDSARCAADAIKAGAYNYIVKTEQYHEILNVLIADAIERFDKYERMKQTIDDLKKRVAELEVQLAVQSQERGNEIKSEKQPERRKSIFDEIIVRIKKGEINLPSPPQIQMKFDQLLREGASISEIAKVLKQDVSICSKLISISNSAYYQGIRENRTVEQAISRLGLITTKKYVEIIYNRALYTTSKKTNTEYMEKLWKHSMCCGTASQITCEILNIKQAEEIFTMGLIHDIGKLMLLQICSEMDINMSAGKMDQQDREELLNIFALNHGAFGATLLNRWGFSQPYQQIAMFHDKLESADPISKELLIIHFANLMAKECGYSWDSKNDVKIEDSLSARLLRIDQSSINTVREKVQSYMSEMQNMF
jgi:HD-like signal output (HDOD) protein/ActR/RegA family two-component response regulator